MDTPQIPQNRRKISLVDVLVIALVPLVVWSAVAWRVSPRLTPAVTPLSSDLAVESSFTLIVEGTQVTIPFREGSTLYDALRDARDAELIDFEAKEYPGLGYFITRIGALAQAPNAQLMYDLNGKEASVGVSAYVLENGDIIEWKLK